MQFPLPFEPPQPGLESLWGRSAAEPAPSRDAFAGLPPPVSEITLRGLTGNCLQLLAPILRELSQASDPRWLTLIATPCRVTHAWLREAGLNRQRILLLHAQQPAGALHRACEALRLGRSHTVVTWLDPLDCHGRERLSQAARQGAAQSLNIRLG